MSTSTRSGNRGRTTDTGAGSACFALPTWQFARHSGSPGGNPPPVTRAGQVVAVAVGQQRFGGKLTQIATTPRSVDPDADLG
jgi:hypothetical protein